ncbi:DUF1761 domain-containing protein [Hyphobacterium sp.]|uniref:DUF1761 domain-containing protein n=1 Tax=Hyphobacterium sp. TaxID=2004662 RepID=UPI003BABAC74
MDLYGINIIAVLLSSVGFMLVGMVWYGPLFGKRWMALNNFTEESLKDGNMAVTMAKGVTNSLVAAIGIGVILAWSGRDGLVDCMIAAALVWLFFSATTEMLKHIWEGQSIELTLIHFGNQLVAYTLAGVIFSFFR